MTDTVVITTVESVARLIVGAAPAVNRIYVQTGPAGPSGTTSVTFWADQPLGGHRLVAADGAGGLRYADCARYEDMLSLLGMTLHAAAAGDVIAVQRYGIIEESTWSWTPDLPVYLGHDGVPTQTLPSDALFSQLVGFPTTPTRLFIGPRDPINLA